MLLPQHVADVIVLATQFQAGFYLQCPTILRAKMHLCLKKWHDLEARFSHDSGSALRAAPIKRDQYYRLVPHRLGCYRGTGTMEFQSAKSEQHQIALPETVYLILKPFSRWRHCHICLHSWCSDNCTSQALRQHKVGKLTMDCKTTSQIQHPTFFSLPDSLTYWVCTMVQWTHCRNNAYTSNRVASADRSGVPYQLLVSCGSPWQI